MRRREHLLLFGVFLAVRLVPFAWERPSTFADSGLIAEQAAAGPGSGQLWAGPRPPLTGLLLWLCHSSPTALMLVQGLVAGLCWAVLALVVAGELTSRSARVVSVLALVLTSATSAFVQWDAAVLPDSLSLSLVVLLVAVVLRYARAPTGPRLLTVGAVALLACLVRDVNSALFVLAALSAGGVALLAQQHIRTVMRLAGVVTVVVLATQALAVPSHRWRDTMPDEIRDRVRPDAAATAFYREHGLPPVPGAPQERWLREHGLRTKAAWIFSHPTRVITRPLQDDNSAPLSSFAGFPIRGFHHLLPSWLARVVRPETRQGIGLEIVAVLCAGLVALRREPRGSLVMGAGLVLLGLVVPHLVFVWNANPTQVARRELGADVQLRLGLVLVGAGALDLLLRSRSSRLPMSLPAPAPAHTRQVYRADG